MTAVASLLEAGQAATLAALRVRQPRDGESRERHYIGLTLTSAHNGADRVPLRAGDEDDGLERGGTRENPLSAGLETALPCDRCGEAHERYGNNGRPCRAAAGRPG